MPSWVPANRRWLYMCRCWRQVPSVIDWQLHHQQFFKKIFITNESSVLQNCQNVLHYFRAVIVCVMCIVLCDPVLHKISPLGPFVWKFHIVGHRCASSCALTDLQTFRHVIHGSWHLYRTQCFQVDRSWLWQSSGGNKIVLHEHC